MQKKLVLCKIQKADGWTVIGMRYKLQVSPRVSILELTSKDLDSVGPVRIEEIKDEIKRTNQ